jgi:cytochrome c oxidase assembly protein subunit 15
MNKHFNLVAKVSLVLVYLVIAAGAVVRMTGSGMGCPDWPKCFGYYIPPTDETDLEWQPGRKFLKGQVIIWNESLLTATTDFTTTSTFIHENWTPYERHDYAVFNVYHTWTEYINRLLGALAGLATLVLAVASISFWRKRPWITAISVLVVLAMGFQAWLGALVVYSVLAPVKITLHMLMALAIVALVLYLIRETSNKGEGHEYDKPTTYLLLLVLLLTLIQVGLGTQVRQFIDEQKEVAGLGKSLWLTDPPWHFYVHRTFSALVLLGNAGLAFRVYHRGLGYKKINWVLALLGIEIISGMAMYYLDFPFGTQTIHLLLATIVFGLQFYLLLAATNMRRKVKTS